MRWQPPPPYLRTLTAHPTPIFGGTSGFFHQNDSKGCKRDFLDARGHFLLRFCAAGDKPSGGGNHPLGRTRVKGLNDVCKHRMHIYEDKTYFKLTTWAFDDDFLNCFTSSICLARDWLMLQLSPRQQAMCIMCHLQVLYLLKFAEFWKFQAKVSYVSYRLEETKNIVGGELSRQNNQGSNYKRKNNIQFNLCFSILL